MTRLSELIRGEAKHTLSMPRWLERLASIGIVTANPEITRPLSGKDVDSNSEAAKPLILSMAWPG
jgi:hypothetical protein